MTHVSPGSHFRVGDRIEFDDPRELAAYEFHSVVAGSTLAVKRMSPLGLALDLLRIEALERELEALGKTAAVFTSSTKSSLSEAPSRFVP